MRWETTFILCLGTAAIAMSRCGCYVLASRPEAMGRVLTDFSDDRYRRHVAEMVRAMIARSTAQG